MIREAIQELAKLTAAATTPLKMIDGPRGIGYHYPSGEFKGVETPIPKRDHSVATLTDLINVTKRLTPMEPAESPEGQDLDTGGSQTDPVVWYDDQKVVVVFDDMGHRVDRTTLPLVRSDAWDTVTDLGNPLSQREFIRLLRIDLAGVAPKSLREKVAKVRFENGSAMVGEHGRASASVGREITSRLANEADLPEEVMLKVKVFVTPGADDEFTISCAVEVDPAAETFSLVPFPDEVTRVTRAAVFAIGSKLMAGLPASVPAFYGRP